ncbi:MAG: sigma-70 family RNA polymerase sigma factor [Planctomycetota bacterium]
MKDEAEIELLRRVRSHDHEAFAEFCERSRPTLLAALERKVGAGLRRKLELEDILQETIARAIRDFPKVDFAGQEPIGWLYTVMDRQIVDLHRFHFEAKKREGAREVSIDSPRANDAARSSGFADLLVASMTSPSQVLSKNIKLGKIYDALSELPEDSQNAIRWRYLENLPSQEIASRLGKTDAATRVLLSRGIRKLQGAVRATR